MEDTIMEPKVSVIIPYFNDGKYIDEAIESVQKQTYTNVEIILVDDGSTDPDSIQKFDAIPTNAKLKKFREDNAGPSVARNFAIVHADGKYILPLDADDKIAPSYIEKAVTVLEQNPECGIVYCQAEFFGKRKGLWDLPEFSLKEMLYHNLIFVTAMFRKEDWEKVNGYDANMKHGIEDYEFWLSILELGRSVYRLPETLFFYRIKKVSRSTHWEENQKKIQDSYDYILKKHKDFYQQHYLEALSELRKDNIEIAGKYERVKNLFPFYKQIKNSGGWQKQLLKRVLHIK